MFITQQCWEINELARNALTQIFVKYTVFEELCHSPCANSCKEVKLDEEHLTV